MIGTEAALAAAVDRLADAGVTDLQITLFADDHDIGSGQFVGGVARCGRAA